MKKTILLLISVTALNNWGKTQVTGDYRSSGSGFWDLPASWEVLNGTTWEAATSKPDSINTVYIQSSHIIALQADEACNDLHIAKGNASTDATQGKVALGSNSLKLFGKLRTYYAPVGNVPGTSTTTMTKTLLTCSSGGKINVVGNTRNLTNTGEWSGGGTTNATDIFSLEINLNDGQSVTMQTSIKASSWMLVSGTLFTGSNRVAVDNGVTGQGDVCIQSNATLSSGATSSGGSAVMGRTSSTKGGILNVNGTLILTGSSPHIAMDSIIFNGSVNYNGSNQAFADSTNGGAAVSSYFNILINGSGVKSISSNIIINGTLIINSGSRLTLNPSFAVTLNTNPGMVIKSDVIGSGSFLDNGTVIGIVKVERYLENDYWHYISSPVSNAMANVFMGDYLAGFNTSNNLWDPNITDPATPLNIMQGYAVNIPNNAAISSFIGPLNTGTLGIGCSELGEGYNLVGNPYPCSIDLSSSGLSWPSDDHTVWFWDPVALNYKVYTTGSTPLHSQYAPAMQGFFIKTTIPGNFQIANTAKVHNSETFLKNTSRYENSLFIKASSEMNDYNDEAVVCFYPQATMDYDPNYDADKIPGGVNAPQLFTLIGRDRKVTVNAQAFIYNQIRIPVGFFAGIEGYYSLTTSNLESFDPSIRIFLEDYTGHMIRDLRLNRDYRFYYSKKDEEIRFFIHFSKMELGFIDTIPFSSFSVYAQNHVVRILNPNHEHGYAIVFDMMGNECFRYTFGEDPESSFTLDVMSGYYIIRVVNENRTFTQKIFIR